MVEVCRSSQVRNEWGRIYWTPNRKWPLSAWRPEWGLMAERVGDGMNIWLRMRKHANTSGYQKQNFLSEDRVKFSLEDLCKGCEGVKDKIHVSEYKECIL